MKHSKSRILEFVGAMCIIKIFSIIPMIMYCIGTIFKKDKA